MTGRTTSAKPHVTAGDAILRCATILLVARPVSQRRSAFYERVPALSRVETALVGRCEYRVEIGHPVQVLRPRSVRARMREPSSLGDTAADERREDLSQPPPSGRWSRLR